MIIANHQQDMEFLGWLCIGCTVLLVAAVAVSAYFIINRRG